MSTIYRKTDSREHNILQTSPQIEKAHEHALYTNYLLAQKHKPNFKAELTRTEDNGTRADLSLSHRHRNWDFNAGGFGTSKGHRGGSLGVSHANYLGDWYEIYKFKADFENGQSCIHANYQKKANGHIQVYNRGQTQDGKITTAIGDGYNPDPNEPAKLAIKFFQNKLLQLNFALDYLSSDHCLILLFSIITVAPYGKYWVLDTDYTSYSLVYSCTDLFSVTHVEFAWILSRQRTLDAAISSRLFNIMKSYNIETSNFSSENQTDCKN
ncbi:APOD [Mytilus edulis]|uniref:APOD n=1 Tax=Mytilus edulis TaxID=6550 RepID=A0A8S3T1C7_MYTED|nr:APOD [Mytilus edulis]